MPDHVPADVDLAAVDAALAPLLASVRAVGADHPGVTVLKGHASDGVVGGQVRHVGAERGWGRPGAAFDALPGLRAALPGDTGISVELQTTPHGWWHLTACWSPALSTFTGISRSVRPLTEPELPQPLPPLAVDRAALASRWAEVRHRHRVGAPADPAAVAAAERELGLALPEPVRALLELTDGAPLDLDAPGDDGDEPRGGLLGWWEPLSLAEIVTAWRQDRAFGTDPLTPYDEVPLHPPGVLVPAPSHPARIPFARDGGGNLLALDLVPGPHGRVGQVVEHGSDYSSGPELAAWSFDDLVARRRAEVPPRPRRVTIDLRRTGGGTVTADQLDPQALGAGVFGLDHLDTRVLAAAPRLADLVLRGRHLDLGGLRALPLVRLRLFDADVLDLSPLAGHPTLRAVEVGPATGRVVGAESLATLPALVRLGLPDVVWPEVASALRDHPTLARADFADDAPFAHTLGLAAAFDRPGDVLAESTLVRSSG